MMRRRWRATVAAVGAVAALGLAVAAQPTVAAYGDQAALRAHFAVETVSLVAQSQSFVALVNDRRTYLYSKTQGTWSGPYTATPQGGIALVGTTNTYTTPTRSVFLLSDASAVYSFEEGSRRWGRLNGLPGPPGAIGAVVNGTGDAVSLTTSGGWWYYRDNTHPNWTQNYPTGQFAAPTMMSGTSFRIVMTDGTGLRKSSNFGNTWEPIPAPTTGIRFVAYATPAMIVFGRGGWYSSLDGGATWAADATLNAAVPTPTAVSGAAQNGEMIIASGPRTLWWYSAANKRLTAIPAPPV